MLPDIDVIGFGFGVITATAVPRGLTIAVLSIQLVSWLSFAFRDARPF
jgi:hypothetical protein